ncbi:Phage integrase family protein [compost metagenome]
MLKGIFSFCTEKGILATDLIRYPKLIDELAEEVAPSSAALLVIELHRLWDAREYIGLYIMDINAIQRLRNKLPEHQLEQTPYIPPRIWSYQIQRLKSCLDEFIFHKSQVEACFDFCIEAYVRNFGSLENFSHRTTGSRNPFNTTRYKRSGKRNKCIFHDAFSYTAERFGIGDLLQKWIACPSKDYNINVLSTYLSLISYAGLIYIANFTLQRISEAMSLKSDCLLFEFDENLGRIPIIVGETTKTVEDSDARWPTSPSVAVAVEAMSTISKMRMKCAYLLPSLEFTESEIQNPFLFTRCLEPWHAKARRKPDTQVIHSSYDAIIRRFPRLFEDHELLITEEDLRIAKLFTPNLGEKYAIGKIWPLAYHQLRRTVAVNMFASNMLSNSSVQFLMKHASRAMPIYYARGYSRLLLNKEVESTLISTMYETLSHHIKLALSDRFVSPLGSDRKDSILVNIVSDKDLKNLLILAKNGQISVRETRLGACTHRGICTYGGIESISRCAGGDGLSPCADALYDRQKESEIIKELTVITDQIKQYPPDSPRYKALEAERNGLENFLDAIRKPHC